MRTLYYFLKRLIRLCFQLYYPRTAVLHGERLQFKEPSILISNHPNTLVDPLQVGLHTNQLVYFLANAGLYSNPLLGKILRKCFTIPIRRREDKNKAKGKVSNAESFRECIDFLTTGGCLWIAPEGGSDMHRKLRPLKTGTARIALATEAANNFQLGLRLQTVGLTYEKPNCFRTSLVIHAGEPIYLKDWQEAFQQNEFQAAKKLTAQIDERLSSLLIDTQDEAEEQLLFRLEQLNRSEGKRTEQEIHEKSQGMLQGLRTLSAAKRDALEKNTTTYFQQLEQLKLSDQSVWHFFTNKTASPLLLKLLLAFPVFLYGLLNNILPVATVLFIVRKLNLYVGYNSTVKILGGLFFFPLFYLLQAVLVYQWSGYWLLSLVYLATLIPSGLFAWRYKNWWQRFQERQRLKQMDFDHLWQRREELKDQLRRLQGA